MILCYWDKNWYLSTGINRDKGICWLRAMPGSTVPEWFKPLPPLGSIFYGEVSLDETVAFYPEIFYHGLKVIPVMWHPDSDEPVLMCEAMPATIRDVSSPYFLEISRSVGGAQYAEEVMLPDGWQRPDRAVYQKYLHVDELEKIEGPPPDGPF